MARDTDDQARPENIGLDSLPSSRRDVVDLNNDIAGREVGRAHRFISPELQGRRADEKRDRERTLSALARLMQNSDYAALYERAVSAVEEAQRASERALRRLNAELDDATQRLERLRNSAARLEDGTAVYRSTRDGRIYTEDGTDVTDRVGEVTGLTDGSPSYEEVQESVTTIQEHEEQITEVQEFQEDVLNPAEDRLNDPNNPMTEQELQDLLSAIDAQTNLQSEVVATSPESPAVVTSAAEQYLGAVDLEAPDLNASFVRAHDAQPATDSPLDHKPDTGPKVA